MPKHSTFQIALSLSIYLRPSNISEILKEGNLPSFPFCNPANRLTHVGCSDMNVERGEVGKVFNNNGKCSSR